MSGVKNYDAILVGTGSGLQVIDALLAGSPEAKVAVIERDQPGGICLTRGCIPSKILLYSAELVRTIERASEFGIHIEAHTVSFPFIMDRMRNLVGKDIREIGEGLRNSENIDYFADTAEFVDHKTLRVGQILITSDLIFLCTGSRPAIPPVPGLEETGYITSDTILSLETPPSSAIIIGGGYIAAEYGHFLAAMGSAVTIVGRNPQFLPDEEPEVSAFAREQLGRHLTILTNYEVRAANRTGSGSKIVTAVDRKTEAEIEIVADEILVATGRSSNTNLLKPEKGGVAVDDHGWIIVDRYRRTSQPGIWAFGDGTGLHQFKHLANEEARIVYHNAVLEDLVEMDDLFVPSAVFTDPEIASVGLKEKDAVESYGEENILIGFAMYEDTAKGLAIGAHGCFVKVIVDKTTNRILGAHIVGPSASVLIQEILTVMQVNEHASIYEIGEAMHIHPALSEVIEHACLSVMTIAQYHHILKDHLGLEPGPGGPYP
jgi:mycothione reductase